MSTLVSDELACRSQRLLARRHKQAQFRDANKQLDNFDFQFNPKMNRSLVFDLAAAGWVERREDSLLLGPPGSGKSHIAQAIGHAVIQQGYRVLYRERMPCSKSWPTPRWTANASNTWNCSPPCRCDHRRSRHAQLPVTAARNCWKSSCAATNAPVRCSRQIGQ